MNCKRKFFRVMLGFYAIQNAMAIGLIYQAGNTEKISSFLVIMIAEILSIVVMDYRAKEKELENEK